MPAPTWAHVVVSVQAVLLAAVVALPVGLWLGHRGRGATVGVVVATRALLTLALLTLLAASGAFGNPATVLAACAVFAVPPLLSGAVTGLGEVDLGVRDAARGVGMFGTRRLGGRAPPADAAPRRGSVRARGAGAGDGAAAALSAAAASARSS